MRYPLVAMVLALPGSTAVAAAGAYRISVVGGQPGTWPPTIEAPSSITRGKELPR
jgi:hypothetical protein